MSAAEEMAVEMSRRGRPYKAIVAATGLSIDEIHAAVHAHLASSASTSAGRVSLGTGAGTTSGLGDDRSAQEREERADA